MSSSQARRRLAQAGGIFAAVALIGGCGNNYRPVVTPVATNGPAPQPISYAVVVSSPSPTSPGIASIIDYSGDSMMAQAPIGIGPLAFTIDEIGGTGYSFNSDHTITNFPIRTDLQQKLELVTTLPATAKPVNILAPVNSLWVGDLTGDVVDLFGNSPQSFQLAIPMAPNTVPAFIAGVPTITGQREYVINQNVPNTSGVECNQTPTLEPNGVATPIEIQSNTIDTPIALDPFAAATGSQLARCPVYAVQTPDQRRLFVLNRGSDTISVINSQNNSLDQCTPFTNQNGQPVKCHPILPLSQSAVTALQAAAASPGAPTGIPTSPPNPASDNLPATDAGPVYAEYNAATQMLVVADYDSSTVSIIDVSLDQYGNDSPTFGTTYTVKVGNNPASVTVLFDGSRAYTADQTDGTVTVVNLSSHSVEKTLTVIGHPRTVVSTENSLYGKVYAGSPDSPYLTILSTEYDLEDATILLEGNLVDVRTTTQSGQRQTVPTYNGSATVSNFNYSSRIPGFGQPCNLPPKMMIAQYGSNYTLANCRAIP